MLERKRQLSLDFVRLVRVHPVVNPAPLRIARIQFLVGQLARIGTQRNSVNAILQRCGKSSYFGDQKWPVRSPAR